MAATSLPSPPSYIHCRCVSCSAGTSWALWLNIADAALYRAKATGRNRIMGLLSCDQVDMDAATLARMSIANMLEHGWLREQDMLRNSSDQTVARPVY